MPTLVLHSLLPAPAGDAPPEWIHLIPAGDAVGRDGRGPFRLSDPAAVIAASMAEGRLPVDENHATDHALEGGGAAPARGWIVELTARPDGIWGRVEWTAAGRALLADRAYRGISPVFEVLKKDGTVLRLLRAALTNAPNLPQLSTLNTQQKGPAMDLDRLREALGLAADADDAAILAAAEANRTAIAAHAQHLADIAGAAGVATGSPAQIVTALQARRAAAATDADALRQTVIALQTQVDTLTAAQARQRAEVVIDAAIRDGKPIAALRDHYIARHTADAAAVELEISKMTSITAGGIAARVPAATSDGLAADEAAVVAMLGIDPAAFVAARAKAGITTGAA